MRKSLFCCTLFLFQFLLVNADDGNPISEYINKWAGVTVNNMRKYGIPASITMAQAIRECGAGNSRMARIANNHFGVKCFGWQGKKYMTGKKGKGSCYRAYADASQSFEDHAKILSSMGRYAFLFKLDKMDYKAWAKGLRKAGYAAQKTYPQLLIKIIEENQLYLLDQRAMEEQMTLMPKLKASEIKSTELEPMLRNVLR